jgi:tetratricopeptide (TPR) repeat protein
MALEISKQTVPKRETFFNEEFLLKNALILIDHGDYDLALNLISTILNEIPEHKESLKWKGYCLFQTGQKEKALEPFLKLAEAEPSEQNYYQLAENLYECAQYELSKVFFEKALDLIDYESPFLFPIYKTLGNICVHQRDFESAEEFYNKAYVLNIHSDELFVNYGTLEIQRGNNDLAQDRFKQALHLNANNVKAWIGLSLVNRSKSDKDLSWANLYRALDIDPTNPTGLKLTVDWSLEDFEFEKAIDRLEKFFALQEPNVEWKLTYAGLLYHAGEWKKARIQCEEILIQKPNYQPALEVLSKLNTSFSV